MSKAVRMAKVSAKGGFSLFLGLSLIILAIGGIFLIVSSGLEFAFTVKEASLASEISRTLPMAVFGADHMKIEGCHGGSFKHRRYLRNVKTKKTAALIVFHKPLQTNPVVL